MLEDDDYSMRAREAGYRIVCAEDAFVHHFGETSFGKLVPTGRVRRAAGREQGAASRRSGASRGSRTSGGASPRLRGPDASASAQIVAENLPAGRDGARREQGRRGAARSSTAAGRGTSRPPRTGAGPATTRPTATRRSRPSRRCARSAGASSCSSRRPASGGSSTTTGFGEHLEGRYPTVVRDEDACVIFALGRTANERAALLDRDPRARPGRAHRGSAWTRSWPSRPASPSRSIVVDDASTDATAELLAGYGERGARRRAGAQRRLRRRLQRRRGAAARRAARLPEQRHDPDGRLARRARRLRRRAPSRRRSSEPSCCSRTTPSSTPASSICQDGRRGTSTRASRPTTRRSTSHAASRP